MDTYTVTTSAELMENYLHADVLVPQDTFLALQTDDGASLLFSIGTGGAFLLTLEEPGHAQGWRQVDLAAATPAADLGGRGAVTTFGAAQTVPARAGDRTEIHLAMVVDDGSADRLYLSLGNSAADLSWADAPRWIEVPFDAVAPDGSPVPPPRPLRITDVYVSEAADREYIVVDTLRDPSHPAGALTRWYLEGTGAGPRWHLNDLAIDVQVGGHGTCLGRAARAFGVDGLYTFGVVGTSAQLVYTPLYNAFDRRLPAPPSRLGLPGHLPADAIAAARNPDRTSDLYVAAAGALYWFAAADQHDGAVGVPVATSPLLSGVRSLYACVADGSVTVWGLNGSDEVFYLDCPLGRQAHAAAWSTPVPILTGVDAISPFVDRGYSANTFFAHSGTGLIKLVKSPTTGLWSRRPVLLPPSAVSQPPVPIHSYTTHVQVTDARHRPAPDLEVTLTAGNVTSVYINHLYYRVGPQPVRVLTDQAGAVTIVETATSLAGTRFTVGIAGGTPVAVNPMDAAWQRNTACTSADALRDAVIHERDGSTRPFLPAGTSQDDLDRVAQVNQRLADTYRAVAAAPGTGTSARRAGPAAAPAAVSAAAGAAGPRLVDIGDLLGMLESQVDALVDVVEAEAGKVWQLVVRIGDAAYHAVLDCVEAVVAAATWIYNALKVAVEEVLKFLEFVFGWQDVLVTHRVLKNVLHCVARSAAEGIDEVKRQVADVVPQARQAIDTWAGIPALPAGATVASSPPPPSSGGAPGSLTLHHFQGGCGSAVREDWPVVPALVEGVLKDLVALVEAEGETLSASVDAIRTQVIEPFTDLPLDEIARRLLAIVLDGALATAENVLVTVLDVLEQLVVGFVELLDAPLDFPVLSWLYRELTGDELSFLDVIALVAAVPATLAYRVAAGGAVPFPADAPSTRALLAARDLAGIRAAFVRPGPPAAHPAAAAFTTAATFTTSPAVGSSPAASVGGGAVPPLAPEPLVLDQDVLKQFAFVTGICTYLSSEVLVRTVNLQRLADEAKAVAVSRTLATISCVGNLGYLSTGFAALATVESGGWSTQLNNVLTVVSILKGVAAIPAAGAEEAKVGLAFAFVETFTSMVWHVPVIANLVDNGQYAGTRYKSIVPESLGNFAFNVAGILELPIEAVDDVEVKLALIGNQQSLMRACGLLLTIAGSIYRFAPGEDHPS